MSSSVSSHRSQKSSSSHRSSKSARSHKSTSSHRSTRSSASAPPSFSSKTSQTSHRSQKNLHSIPEGPSRSSHDNEDPSSNASSSILRPSSHRRKASSSSMRSSSFQTVASSSRSIYSTSTMASTRASSSKALIIQASSHFRSANYLSSVLLYTQTLGMYVGEAGNPLEGGTEESVERRMGSLYVGRAQSLWALGEEKLVFGPSSSKSCWKERHRRGSLGSSSISARGSSVRSEHEEDNGGGIYAAITRDTRMALECERISACKLTLHSSERRMEEGAVVRAKALCLLGYSLLRRGIVEGVSDAFEGSIDVAKQALGGDKCNSRDELQKTIDMVKDGLAELGRYEMLSTHLRRENKSPHDIFLHDLLDILKISPASDKWNVEMIRFLMYQRRWFAVANYCERIACKVLEVEKVYEGDLKCFHINADVPDAGELTPRFFEETEEKRDSTAATAVPFYLRTVSDKWVADIALRLSEGLLPIYLRALRLEERLSAGLCAANVLIKMGGSRQEFAEKEISLLQDTIKLKDDANRLFREGAFEQAVELYDQCLKIETDPSPGGRLHAVLHSNKASCFSSLGRYDEAIIESTSAINIHSMYMKALLRRARCYVKEGDLAKAQGDYQRWNMLVEKARRQPYPGINIGPACFFDMPSEVKTNDWNAVKSEISELGITISSPVIEKPKSFHRPLKFGRFYTSSRLQSYSKLYSSLKSFFCCEWCKKNVRSQVISGTSEPPPPAPSLHSDQVDNSESSRESIIPTRPDRLDLPQNSRKTIEPSDTSSQNPIEFPIKIDENVDYYKVLECTPSASSTELKMSYKRLAKVYHSDRSAISQERFEEIKLAFGILTDPESKTKYDKARVRRLEP